MVTVDVEPARMAIDELQTLIARLSRTKLVGIETERCRCSSIAAYYSSDCPVRGHHGQKPGTTVAQRGSS